MKKAAFLFLGVTLLVLIYAIGLANSENVPDNQSSSDYIIIRYTPVEGANRFISIHYGGDKVEEVELTKEQTKLTVSNYVIDRLSKFRSEGYELVTSTSVGVNGQVNCYLQKVK